MTGLAKVTIILLLGASSLHQSAALLAWKRWPLFEFGQPHSLQGPSSLALSVWNDLDDMWPSVTHSLMKTHPSNALQVPHSRCRGGGWVQHDKNDVENQFDTEERQLQLREDQLRKEWKDLNGRREDHKRKEEQRRFAEEQRQREERLRRERVMRQHQELRAREEKQRLEEQRRVQREREELKRKMMEEQEARRQQEMRAREEKKRLEEQRRLERERQERLRREEIERRRLAEEREIKWQQQQESVERERQRQELKRRQSERESNEQNIRHKSRNSLPKSEIGNLNIPEGYNLDDITVETIGYQILVKGHHVCGCDENCFEREFERRLSLPKNVDSRTLSASLYSRGQLSLQGVQYRQDISPVDTAVVVEGVGLQRTQTTSDNSCKARKAGFKLKKINARTGEIFDDIELMEESYPVYESEIDEDGLTIEVVE